MGVGRIRPKTGKPFKTEKAQMFFNCSAMQRSAPLKRRPSHAHSLFAAGKSPTQIDAVESLLDRTMGFDKPHVRVDRQILRHRRVGVEPYRRQATTPGLADGVINELAPQTFALPRRVDRDIVDEV